MTANEPATGAAPRARRPRLRVAATVVGIIAIAAVLAMLVSTFLTQRRIASDQREQACYMESLFIATLTLGQVEASERVGTDDKYFEDVNDYLERLYRSTLRDCG